MITAFYKKRTYCKECKRAIKDDEFKDHPCQYNQGFNAAWKWARVLVSYFMFGVLTLVLVAAGIVIIKQWDESDSVAALCSTLVRQQKTIEINQDLTQRSGR